jgi:hypothetical protein
MGFKHIKDISQIYPILENEEQIGIIPNAQNVFFEV